MYQPDKKALRIMSSAYKQRVKAEKQRLAAEAAKGAKKVSLEQVIGLIFARLERLDAIAVEVLKNQVAILEALNGGPLELADEPTEETVDEETTAG